MRFTLELLLQEFAKNNPSMLATSLVASLLKGNKTVIQIIGKPPEMARDQLSSMSTVTVCLRREIIQAT